jgi:hypothetical protein
MKYLLPFPSKISAVPANRYCTLSPGFGAAIAIPVPSR